MHDYTAVIYYVDSMCIVSAIIYENTKPRAIKYNIIFWKTVDQFSHVL